MQVLSRSFPLARYRLLLAYQAMNTNSDHLTGTADQDVPAHSPADPRSQFEAWYCQHAKDECGFDVRPEEVAAMRTGDSYGNRGYLNGCWEGWKGANAEGDAARYRKLRRWMGGNVIESWQRVEEMGAVCAWEGFDVMDAYLDALPECDIGLCSKAP